jgi:hypothetical protein
MPLNITDYFRVMQERDFLRNHQYRVNSFLYEGFQLGPDSLVYLKTAELPSRTINSVAVPFMGLNFSVPGTAQYAGTMDLTFYCDSPQIIRNFFEGISFATFDNRTSGGAYTVRQENVMSFYTYNNVSPDEVVTQYTLVGIYPTSVGAIAMDTTGNGEVVSFTAQIAYQYWEKSLPGPNTRISQAVRTAPPSTDINAA